MMMIVGCFIYDGYGIMILGLCRSCLYALFFYIVLVLDIYLNEI